MIDGSAQFAGRAGFAAGLRKSYCHVGVIVRSARIVLDRFLEVVGSFLLSATGGDYSQIVVNLGERQADGDELEGIFGFRKIRMSVGGETEVEIGLAGDGG